MKNPEPFQYHDRANDVVFYTEQHARWGKFFDELGINFEYQPEGYLFAAAETYVVPDFFLPEFEGGCYLIFEPELLPTPFLREAKGVSQPWSLDIGYRLCQETGHAVWIAGGDPAVRVYYMFKYFGERSPAAPGLVWGIPAADQASERQLFTYPGYENDNGTIHESNYQCVGKRYIDAVEAAREFNPVAPAF